MKKVVFFNTKGGTGKTTLCYNYGWYLAAKRRKRVLFLDFDPQINLVRAFRDIPETASEKTLERLIMRYITKEPAELRDFLVRINDHIDLLPSSNNISQLDERLTDYLLQRSCQEGKVYRSLHRNIIIKRVLEGYIREGNYDYVLIDSQPNYSLLSTTAILYAQNIVVVLRPELFSYLDVHYLFKIEKTLEEKFGVDIRIIAAIINGFETGRKICQTFVDGFRFRYGERLPILSQKLRHLSPYQMSITMERLPVFLTSPSSEASIEIIKAFHELDALVDQTAVEPGPENGQPFDI